MSNCDNHKKNIAPIGSGLCMLEASRARRRLRYLNDAIKNTENSITFNAAALKLMEKYNNPRKNKTDAQNQKSMDDETRLKNLKDQRDKTKADYNLFTSWANSNDKIVTLAYEQAYRQKGSF